ncbi:MAG: secretin N-terminal domain-containing protein [Planctomycetota bacterium]
MKLPDNSVTAVRVLAPALPPVLALLLAAASLSAQVEEPKPPWRISTEGDYIVIAVDENKGMAIKDFIKVAQVYTNKVYTFDESDFQNPDNKINFIGSMKIKKDNFFSFFQTVMYMKDFACVLRGDSDTEMVQIIFIRGPKRPEIATGARLVMPEDLDQYKNQTGVQVVTSIRLEHVAASKATATVRPFFAGGGAGAGSVQIGTAGTDRNVLLQGFGTQVYQAAKLFDLVDQPEDVVDLLIEPHRLVHANAEELEPLLNDLLGDRNRPQPGQPAGQPGAASQTPPIKILAQSTTNTLILSGTREQVNVAKDIIAQLDLPLEITGGDSHVIRLQNVLAKDLRDTLNRFITDELQAEQQARAGGQQQARRPRKPVIIAHEESNSILLSAPASKYAQLRKMIDDLDVRQPQVLIECAVVELSTTDLMRYGIELGILDLGGEGENWNRGFGFLNAGLTSFEDTDDDGLPDTRLPDFENPLQGFTGGVISSDDFAIPVLINALAQADSANVLSMPSVLVNNNENALVESQENRPTSEVSQGTATTTSGFQGFQDAGITLEISPSISTNNYLRLNITLEVSRFTTPYDPNSSDPGVKATRRLQTQVTMPSDHTMVLGGVIEDAEAKTEQGIPYLKDIPVLGWLFKSKTNEYKKVNLYFFLTPHILDEDDFADLENLSFRKKLEAEQYIGKRRIQIMDPKWRGQAPGILEDPHATIEDLDRQTNSEFPLYRAPTRKTTSTQPALPRSVNVKENK